MRTKKHFTEEFKREALRLVESGQSVEQVALDLGVGKSSLWRWRLELRSRSGPEAQMELDLQKENERLLKRIHQLEEEREILKKATAFFAKENR
jgi:transposase